MTMLRALLLLMLVTAAGVAQTRGPLDLANAPVPPGARRLTYGPGALQFGELRVPPSKGKRLHPVAIVVHGGCWVAQLGDMDPRAVAIDNMRPFSAALTAAGIATWNIEYRRVGHDGGGFPGTFQDIGNAADFLRTIAADNQLDLKRVIAVGHSAGGHLATWLAARPKLPKSSLLFTADPLPLRGVVNLDGPADLQATIPLQEVICSRQVVTDLMGGWPEAFPGRYRDASPIEMLPLGVPQHIFAGRMFASLAPAYEVALQQTKDPWATTVLPEAGHFGFIDPQSAIFPQVLQVVRLLLSMSR
jgi:acetyl esterase/lipase